MAYTLRDNQHLNNPTSNEYFIRQEKQSREQKEKKLNRQEKKVKMAIMRLDK